MLPAILLPMNLSYVSSAKLKQVVVVNIEHNSATIKWTLDDNNETYTDSTLEKTRVQIQNRFGIIMRDSFLEFNQSEIQIKQLVSGQVYRVCVAFISTENEIVGNERCITLTTKYKLWNSLSKAALAMAIIIVLLLATIKILDLVFPQQMPAFQTDIVMREKSGNVNKIKINRQSFDFDGIDVDDTASSTPVTAWVPDV